MYPSLVFNRGLSSHSIDDRAFVVVQRSFVVFLNRCILKSAKRFYLWIIQFSNNVFIWKNLDKKKRQDWCCLLILNNAKIQKDGHLGIRHLIIVNCEVKSKFCYPASSWPIWIALMFTPQLKTSFHSVDLYRGVLKKCVNRCDIFLRFPVAAGSTDRTRPTWMHPCLSRSRGCEGYKAYQKCAFKESLILR